MCNVLQSGLSFEMRASTSFEFLREGLAVEASFEAPRGLERHRKGVMRRDHAASFTGDGHLNPSHVVREYELHLLRLQKLLWT